MVISQRLFKIINNLKYNSYSRLLDFKELAKNQNVTVNDAVDTIDLEKEFLPNFLFMNDG